MRNQICAGVRRRACCQRGAWGVLHCRGGRLARGWILLALYRVQSCGLGLGCQGCTHAPFQGSTRANADWVRRLHNAGALRVGTCLRPCRRIQRGRPIFHPAAQLTRTPATTDGTGGGIGGCRRRNRTLAGSAVGGKHCARGGQYPGTPVQDYTE